MDKVTAGRASKSDRRGSAALSEPDTLESIDGNDSTHSTSSRPLLHWRRELSGHSIDIQVLRKSDSERSTPKSLKSKDSRPKLRQKSISDSTVPVTNAEKQKKKGLWQRAKHLLDVPNFFGPRPTNEMDLQGTTKRTSDASINTFDFMEGLKKAAPERKSSQNSQDTASSQSLRAKLKRPLFIRKKTDVSVETPSKRSTSTLTIELPQPVLDPKQMFCGADGREYGKVEISGEGQPNFLPSEARRLDTPVATPRPYCSSRQRGFFFDFDSQLEPCQRQAQTRNGSRVDISKDWYGIQLDMLDREEDDDEPHADVPDHFYNSPLCPRHPKHKFGGIGTCPIHGRNI